MSSFFLTAVCNRLMAPKFWSNFFGSSFFEWFVVMSFVLVGGWMRFVNFPNTLVWTNDSARDISVSYLIAQRHIWPTIGHFNTGTNGTYPPFYFYFLGGLAMIDSSPAFIAGVNVFFHILSLITYYLIGRICLGKKFGWLVLFAASFSTNLIFTARYPSPASWNLSLYLISFWVVLSWLDRPKIWKLMLSLGIGLVSLQIHGAQIGLVLMVLALWLGKIFIGGFKQKQQKILFAIWLLFAGLTAASQLTFFQALFDQKNISVSWSIMNLVAILQVAVTNLFSDLVSLKLIGVILFGGFFGLMIKTWFKNRLKLNRKDFQLNFLVLPSWWWFCLIYAGLFELALSALATGQLNHHQVYLLPCWLVLILGLAKSLWYAFQLKPFFQYLGMLLIGGLLIKSLAINGYGELVTVGWFNQTQDLVLQMAKTDYPITTADVLFMDNKPDNSAEVSNSTKVWWFLITEYGRQDLYPLAWIFDQKVFQAEELILICDVAEAEDFGANCEAQANSILAKRYKSLQLIQANCLKAGFEVRHYQALNQTD